MLKQAFPDCDHEVGAKGTVVTYCRPLPTDRTEKWVTFIRERSGQRVDWHRFAGRVVVKAIGDMTKVHEALVESRDLFRKLFDDGSDDATAMMEIADNANAVWRNDLDADLEMWPSDGTEAP